MCSACAKTKSVSRATWVVGVRKAMFVAKNSLPVSLFVSPFLAKSNAKCPSGYIQGLADGLCYYTSHEAASWSDAEDNCRKRDGHLASIHNAFKNSFLYRTGFTCSSQWVGASRGVTTSTNWTWTDGSAFSWSNWDRGRQPEKLIQEVCELAKHFCWTPAFPRE